MNFIRIGEKMMIQIREISYKNPTWINTDYIFCMEPTKEDSKYTDIFIGEGRIAHIKTIDVKKIVNAHNRTFKKVKL
jgi:hypothetical protein